MTPEALARALLRAKPTLGGFASGGHGNGSAKARFHGALAEWQVVVNEVIVECKNTRWQLFDAVGFREACGYWPEKEQPVPPRHFTPARITAIRKFKSTKKETRA